MLKHQFARWNILIFFWPCSNWNNIFLFYTVVLDTPLNYSLDDCIEYIQEDELVEVTPSSIRMCKNPKIAAKRRWRITDFQLHLHEAINHIIPIINSESSFENTPSCLCCIVPDQQINLILICFGAIWNMKFFKLYTHKYKSNYSLIILAYLLM